MDLDEILLLLEEDPAEPQTLSPLFRPPPPPPLEPPVLEPPLPDLVLPQNTEPSLNWVGGEEVGVGNLQSFRDFITEFSIPLEDFMAEFEETPCIENLPSTAMQNGADENAPIHELQLLLPTEVGFQRTALALQRERTASMELRELADYFHLPIMEAARQLGMCTTALKNISRRYGLTRWPSRKIQAVDREIVRLKKELARNDEIQAARMKRDKIYKDILALVAKNNDE